MVFLHFSEAASFWLWPTVAWGGWAVMLGYSEESYYSAIVEYYSDPQRLVF